MSTIAKCPTCGSTSSIKEKEGTTIYQAIQDEDALKKIGQLKKAMEKFKLKAEELELELAALKASK
ncbi:MAG: hypothetical protein P8I78_04175 [Flavobacterium sp.]|uniref:hypothetical protein n=1 Tax=Flavobacterium frigidarium TaxID=99286 RepID=UPI0030D92283|nr:hypothetical protein [Flavobacterium sp.]|tara:strand:+ start:12648 stop:12845 length:198 start_codon:yes stop_codon:yes gene_type:complete